MRFALFKKSAKSDLTGVPSPTGPAKFPSHEEVVSGYSSSNLPGWIFLPTTVLIVAIL